MATKRSEISLSIWFFIIASIIISSALLVVGFKWFANLRELSAKTHAEDEFGRIADAAKSICDRDVGSKQVILLTINDYILAVYAVESEDENDFPQTDACLLDINSEECTSTGINLCLGISRQAISCEKLTCNIQMHNFGAPKSGFKSIINKITKKGTYDIQLTIERTSEGITILPKFVD